MTRNELSQRMNKVMNVIEDYTNNNRRVSISEFEDLVSELDMLTEKLMCDGLEG